MFQNKDNKGLFWNEYVCIKDKVDSRGICHRLVKFDIIVLNIQLG